MNRSTHLCSMHSGRQTRPACTDCLTAKRLAIHDRRLRDLEEQVKRLESQLAALEIIETADTPRVEA